MASAPTHRLPNEIWSTIFSSTKKKDLKNVRLSSRLFYALATPSLFDTIFIGPSRITLEVFQNIVSHPYLSRHIKTLVYDAVYFREFRRIESYTRDFASYYKVYYARKCRKGSMVDEQNASVTKLETCIFLRYGCKANPETTPLSSNDLAKVTDAVAKGYERWQMQQTQQAQFALGPEMQFCLTVAFSKIPNLASFKVQRYWGEASSGKEGDEKLPALSIKPDSAGPLARSWIPWHLPPGQPTGKGTQSQALDLIISTLAVSHRFSQTKNLTRLTLAFHVSPFDTEFEWNLSAANGFYTESRWIQLRAQSWSERWSDVISSLTHIKLHIYVDPLGHYRTIRGLQSVALLTAPLANASRLQHLSIHVDRMFVHRDTDSSSYYRITELCTAPNYSFNSLITLKLRGFRGTAEEFTSFISAQPALRHVNLGALSFMGGQSGGPKEIVSLPALVDGMARGEHKSWSLGFPLFEESTRCLVPKKGSKMVACREKYIKLRKEAAKSATYLQG
ncbi:MAG: hypothetical protein Q9216_004822 [Gyalolechia sp. 2 TL-2023]